jgi:hypothetical protein
MPFSLNPFRGQDKKEFLGVVIPLSQASRFSHLNPHTVSDDEVAAKDDKKLDRVGSDENGAASNPEYSHQTIEAIRAEVESEVSASGHDTAYDRM